MNLNQIDIKNFILALFKRDDGERILLGAGAYDFKDSLQHFQANIIANDIIEKQGTDGQLLAGQVRRCQTQTFEGYIGDASTSRIDTEDYRRKFIQFFRTNHFYTVIYIMPNGDAIQRKNGYLVEAPSAPEQYQRFPEYSVGFQFEDLNYYTYSEDDQGEETYAQTVDILPEGNLTGGLVWDGDGVVWDYQGKHIAELKGDTYQVTTTGKNLLDIDQFTTTGDYTGLTVQIIDKDENTGSFSIKLTGDVSSNPWSIFTRTDDLQLEPNTAYTLSRTFFTSGGTLTGAGGIRVKNGSSYTTTSYANSVTFTTTSTGIIQVLAYAAYNQSGPSSNVNSTVTFSSFQLEKTASKTAFEPYTGASPAPSPSFPESVQTATGSQTVAIIGKNCFAVGDKTATDVTMTLNQDGSITVQGTASAARDLNNYLFELPLIENGATYTFWYDGDTLPAGSEFRAGLYKGSTWVRHLIGSGQVLTSDTKVRTGTANTTGADRLRAQLHIASGTTINATFRVQLEKSATKTAFEAYNLQELPLDLGAIELAKLDTYQDYIWKDGEDWKVEKNTSKRTFNGDDTDIEAGGWFNSSQTTTTVQVSALTIRSLGVKFSERKSSKMSHFGYIGDADPVYDGSLSLANNISGVVRHIRLGISKTIAADLTAAKAWIAANLPTLYFPAYTSTTTTITDANLIAQLDAIDEALEAGGTTTVIPAAGNRAAIITTQPSGNGGAVWDASGGHSTNTITVGGLFAVQPVWIIDGPAESPVMENITDGTSLSYIGVIPAGQTLVIDCTNQTAYLDGANVKNNVRGTWQSFSPGEVTIRYSGANVTQASTLKWNEVVG